MGVVWEARDELLQRRVAIKQLRPQVGISDREAELAKDRAMREARLSARLHHPNAVPVFDVVEHEGQPCLVLQFLPSIPLSAVLAEAGPLAVHETALMGAQVASALAAAHRLGIVHRDVKPGNVLIADDGAALISDFGISHAMGDATLTSTGLVHGTPAYLAPEVARGEDSGFAADVFSLGSTLYAALEGTPPFGTDPNSIALLHRVATADFPPTERAGALTPALTAMLQADPSARPTMSEVASWLAAVAAAVATAGPSPGQVDGESPTVALPGSPPSIDPIPAASAAPDPAPPTATSARATPTAQQAPTVAVAPVAPAGRPFARGAGSASSPRRRRTAPVLAVLALLLIGGLVTAVLINGSGDGSVAQPATTPTGTRAPSSDPSGSDGADPNPRSTSPSTPSSPAPQQTPAPTPTETPTSSPSETKSSGTPSESDLAGALRTYYGLVPDKTDEAWLRLTPRFQQERAGGRAGYDRYWNSVRRVRVTKVKGDAPSTAVATITYTYEDGRVVTERTSYTLVEEDGLLKIDDSTILG
jgi:serine/threonine protein kinase